MRWLVTGAGGMLGRDVVVSVAEAGHEVTALGRTDLDITDPQAVYDAAAGHDVVVNCAAWTAVDDAEAHSEAAFAANATGAGVVAAAAAVHGARAVQISTDYVFDGTATEPYPEDAPLSPASAYGRTKAAGEHAVRTAADDHLVVRTAWLYGAGGPCFPATIARLAAERGSVDVVTDQVGQPTWTVDVADLLVRLVAVRAPAGTYHATSSGQCSWFEFAQAVVASAGLDPQVVHPTTSEAFVRPAPRPAYSVLGHGTLEAAGIDPIADWRERWEAAADAVVGG